jgi:hypothetical protein
VLVCILLVVQQSHKGIEECNVVKGVAPVVV